MTIQDIRRANLRAWVQKHGSPSREKSYFSQILSGTAPIGERAARRLERDYRMGDGFLDMEHAPVPEPTPEPPPAATSPGWPFPSISEDQIRALTPKQLSALEGAMALAVGQMKLGIDIAPPPAKPRGTQCPPGVVDMDTAPDEFPMAPILPDIPGDRPAGIPGDRAQHRAPFSREGVVANVGPGEPYAANDKFEKVSELADVRLAAGEGFENENELVTGSLQFRRSFLREVGADGGRGVVVYAKGNSMAPLIQDGAALLVVPNYALTMRDLAAGGVYAINYDGKMIVKSVGKDKATGRWVARSVNPSYPDIDLENGASVRVLGRVVWVGFKL